MQEVEFNCLHCGSTTGIMKVDGEGDREIECLTCENVLIVTDEKWERVCS